jgi:hypothetical protein
MANTYTLISSVTVGSGGASSIDFTSIPSIYTDLELKLSFRFTSNSVDTYLKFNNSSSAQYGYRYLRFNPAVGVASGTATGQTIDNYAMFSNASTWTSNTFGNAEIYIPSYLASQNKPISAFGVTETNASAAYMGASAILWRNTAAITSIQMSEQFDTNLLTGSSFYLNGISNA